MRNILIESISGKCRRGENMAPKGIYQTLIPWEYNPENPFSPRWQEDIVKNNSAKEKVVYLSPIKEIK